jgi:hypothetical protein
MTVCMSFKLEFEPPECRSVEIESGRNPSWMIDTAIRQVKLPEPCPTSKITPRLRPSISAGFP